MDPEGSERHRSLAMRCGWCVRLKMPGTGLHEALVRDRESCVEKRSVRSQDERKCRLPEGERERRRAKKTAAFPPHIPRLVWLFVFSALSLRGLRLLD